MIVAVDADVLVSWAMSGAPRHRPVRRFVDRAVAEGKRIGIPSQVAWEFLHICTDGKRFERPLAMDAAMDVVRELRASPDVCDLDAGASVVDRVVELLARYRLGRKRILDTVLAATLEAGKVKTLATFNAKDYEVFPFLELVTPR